MANDPPPKPDAVSPAISPASAVGRMARLRRRAERASIDGVNEITGGRVGERVLRKVEVRGVWLIQLEDDPEGVLRVSAGEAAFGRLGTSTYCVFRGERDGIERLLARALRAVRRMPPEPTAAGAKPDAGSEEG